MGIAIMAAVKMLELSVNIIEAAIKEYDSVSGKDLIAEIEGHMGKLGELLNAVKSAAPAVESAISAAVSPSDKSQGS